MRAKAKIMLAILSALLFGFGVYCALAVAGLNAELSFSIGWAGFAVAVVYLDEHEGLKDKIAEIEQERSRSTPRW